MLNKLLKAEGEELSRLLGGILQPEKVSHKQDLTKKMDRFNYMCKKCGKSVAIGNFTDCIPDPIPLDNWPEAIRFRDKYVAEFGAASYRDMLVITTCKLTGLTPVGTTKRRQYAFSYLAVHGKPVHILLTCAGLEIGRGKNE